MALSSRAPQSFKSLVPYLRHAEQLDRAGGSQAPMVAYFCRAYAMDLGIKAQKDSPGQDANAFLLELMSKLEADKAELPKYQAEEGQDFVKTFALGVFKKADDEDRGGRASKQTAKTYYAAASFFDVMKQFGPLDDDVAQMCKYAKWKTTDIMKAIKEGRRPTPGPPGGLEAEEGLDIGGKIDDAAHAPASVPPPGGIPVAGTGPSCWHVRSATCSTRGAARPPRHPGGSPSRPYTAGRAKYSAHRYGPGISCGCCCHRRCRAVSCSCCARRT